MKKSKIVGMIISAIVVVVGVFAVVYNAVIVYNSELKYFNYKTADASISMVQSTYIDGTAYYKAVYSFTVNNGTYTCNSTYTDDPDLYTVGDVGKVKFNPDNPAFCHLVKDDTVWSYLYLGISCIVLIIGIKIFDKQLRVR